MIGNGPMSSRTVSKLGLFLALLLAFTTGATAQSGRVQVFGQGNISCASWLQNSVMEAAGDDWVQGFWSGANAALQAQTGHSTDGVGVLGEVKLECEAHPSEQLFDAAVTLYVRFRGQGK